MNESIVFTRTDKGDVTIDMRMTTDNLLMNLARMHRDRREELHDLLTDLLVLEAAEARGYHVQENSVTSVLGMLYEYIGTPETSVNRDDVNRLRRALDDPDAPRPRPAFAANGQGMQAMAKVEPAAPKADTTTGTPIYDKVKNGG